MITDEQIEKIKQEVISHLSVPSNQDVLSSMYEKWYRDIYDVAKVDSFTHEVGYLPSLDGIKKRFEFWFNKFQKEFREKLCPRWNELSSTPNYGEKYGIVVSLVIEIVESLIPESMVSHIAVVVIILITDGYLNKLCANNSKN